LVAAVSNAGALGMLGMIRQSPECRTELMANYAGQRVGLIHDIPPAAEIVEQMVSEAEAIIRRLPTMLA
jgi:NAD(P)H-dependent flavin oxidoreductase YrpB (nitropropane dioxygenase family)